MKDEAEWKRIERAHTSLVIDEPFFAALLFRLRMIDAPVGTACTDGVNLWIDTNFTKQLTHGQLVTLLAHEVMHPAMGHLWRLKDYPHDIANAAADFEENLILEECNERVRKQGSHLVEPFPFPPGALKDERFRGMAAELIAKQLMNERQHGGGKGNGKGQGSAGDGSQDGSGDDSIGGADFGKFTQPAISEAEYAKLKQEWEVDVVNAAKIAKMMGKCPGSIERMVSEILNPKKSWKDILREFVRAVAHDDYAWHTPARRYASSGFILPSLRSNRMGTIVYIRDTSGSMMGMEVECNSEVQGILDEVKPEKTIVIDCDAGVHQVFELAAGEAINASAGAKLRGGGGTDFRPAFDKVDELIQAGEEVACVIWFTDGYGTYPQQEPAYPVLWAATTDYQFPWGQEVRLSA